MMFYAGIGSRETPPEYLDEFKRLASNFFLFTYKLATINHVTIICYKSPFE